MVTVHFADIEARLSQDQLLEAIKQLDEAEFEHLFAEVLHIRAKRRAPSLSANETRLLLQINQEVPDEIQERYDSLIAKQRGGALPPDEHAELGGLIKTVEQLEVQRVQALVELAQLRGVPMEELLQTLGIQPKING